MKTFRTFSYLLVTAVYFFVGCSKQQEIPSLPSKSKNFTHIRQQADAWYRSRIERINLLHATQELPVIPQSSITTANDYAEAFKNDTSFVSLCYKVLYGIHPMLDYYQTSTGTQWTDFNDRMKLTGTYASLSRTFTAFGVSEDPFFDYNAHIFASCAFLYSRYPGFSNLPQDQQVAAINSAIAFNFGGGSLAGEVSTMDLWGDVGLCLAEAVGGYLIGNYRLIRSIASAITGSPMGYAFVYATAGRILKQSIINAGGVWGIAASFAFCMIF